MESIRVITDLEQQGFSDEPHAVAEVKGTLVIGGMGEATLEGNPVVMLGVNLGEEDGVEEETWLVKQTTLSLFLSAADALVARYGDPRVSNA